jgi:hypothetical protein
MKHVMPHDLSPELARKAAVRAFEAYAEKYAKYDPRINWASETVAKASFNAKGVTLRGIIEVQPSAIAFDLDVPFVLRMFKNKAFAVMERELQQWVAKAKAGEL